MYPLFFRVLSSTLVVIRSIIVVKKRFISWYLYLSRSLNALVFDLVACLSCNCGSHLKRLVWDPIIVVWVVKKFVLETRFFVFDVPKQV